MRISPIIKLLWITVCIFIVFIASNSVLISSAIAQIACDSLGKVGIGMVEPVYNLDVSGDINFTGNIYKDGVPFISGTSLWEQSGGNVYRSSGNVGIGTTIPAYRLEVNGAIYANSTALASDCYRWAENYQIIIPAGAGPAASGKSRGIGWTEGGVVNCAITNIDVGLSGASALIFLTGNINYVGEKMRITSGGYVGIGTDSPSYLLSVNGHAGKPLGGTWSDFSDRRLKKNVQSLTGALDKLVQLRGVTFEWINSEEHPNQAGDLEKDQNQVASQEKNTHQPSKRAGLIAQEVEEVFPEWVLEVEAKGADKKLVADNKKTKALYFPHEFNAYLIEAIKELKAEIDTVKAENIALKERVKRLEK